jgi:hypothetical protein
MYLAHRIEPNGNHVCVMPLTFGRARIGIGDATGFRQVW